VIKPGDMWLYASQSRGAQVMIGTVLVLSVCDDPDRAGWISVTYMYDNNMGADERHGHHVNAERVMAAEQDLWLGSGDIWVKLSP
jgi:hypothetical protein